MPATDQPADVQLDELLAASALPDGAVVSVSAEVLAPPPTSLKDDGFSTQAALLARQNGAGREQAASLLYRHRGRRLQHYFMHNKVREAEAEELMSEVVFNFISQPPAGGCPAEVWLWTLARNELIDWARRRATQSRGGNAAGGPMEQAFDADAWLAVLETTAADAELPAWVKTCVHRAAAQLERDEPATAQVLLFKAQGWSAREIAIYYGAPPEKVSKAAEGAARDRVYRAAQVARDYFQHCKE